MKLVTQMEPVELHIDEHLFREGDPDVYLYIVREGEISIHLKDEAGRIEVDTRKPGDSIQSLLSVLDMLVGLPDPRLKTVSAKATKERTVVQCGFEESFLIHSFLIHSFLIIAFLPNHSQSIMNNLFAWQFYLWY